MNQDIAKSDPANVNKKKMITLKTPINKAYSILLLIILSIPNVGTAQDSLMIRLYKFDIPIFDFPYQRLAAATSANHRNGLGADMSSHKSVHDYLAAFGNPSMNQSLNWGASWLTLLGAGVNSAGDKLIKPSTGFKRVLNRVTRELAFTGSNFILIYFPLGDGWVHEEFHRAMMTTNKVYSYDDVNSFRSFGSDHISVVNETDDDLAYFKRKDPQGFNRMLAAGGEGELLLTRKLYLNNFFYRSGLPITLYSDMVKALVITYPNSDADTTGLAELLHREMNETKISERDFTGPDYSGWTWHIFKPDVPYDSLGKHPSGIGINRYKSAVDLTSEEIRYLKKVGRLMYLNFISPMTIGINRIRFGKGKYANFAVQTFINGFGYDINPEVYLKTPMHNVYFGVHSYHNYKKSFLGIEAGTYLSKITIAKKELKYDSRFMLWSQPRLQEFKTSSAEFGFLAQAKIYYPIHNWLNAYMDIEGKTDGWVAGNPFLKKNISVRIGCSINIFNNNY